MKLLTVVVVCFSVGYGNAYLTSTSKWSFEGKNVVVTGGAQGIGYAIADNFLKNNVNKVFIVDKNATQGKVASCKLKSIYGNNKVKFYNGDITKDLKKISTDILNKYYIDVLVNNAGVVNETDADYTIGVNAIGTVNWGQKFFDAMSKENGGNGGTIINVSSILGYLKFPLLIIYSSTKAAILSFTYSLGHPFTYRSSGVRVLALCPGFTNTELTRIQIYPDERQEILSLFSNTAGYQEPEHVGKSAMKVYETAATATAWTIKNSQEPVMAPDSQEVTAQQLDALIAASKLISSV